MMISEVAGGPQHSPPPLCSTPYHAHHPGTKWIATNTRYPEQACALSGVSSASSNWYMNGQGYGHFNRGPAEQTHSSGTPSPHSDLSPHSQSWSHDMYGSNRSNPYNMDHQQSHSHSVHLHQHVMSDYSYTHDPSYHVSSYHNSLYDGRHLHLDHDLFNHPKMPKVRNTANKKERRRTVQINTAFNKLRHHIPNVPKDTKLSKIKTLRLANSYISYLRELLQSEEPGDYNQFKADLNRKPERRADKKKTIEMEIAAAAEKKARGRTGWPQTVWDSELRS